MQIHPIPAAGADFGSFRTPGKRRRSSGAGEAQEASHAGEAPRLAALPYRDTLLPTCCVEWKLCETSEKAGFRPPY